MAAVFFEGKTIPRGLLRMSHYARASMGDGTSDSLNAVANIVGQASPWNLLTGLFVTKPAAEAQAALQAQEINAEQVTAAAAQRADTIRTIMYVGAGLAGVAVLALTLSPSKQPAVHGYRRKSRRSRR